MGLATYVKVKTTQKIGRWGNGSIYKMLMPMINANYIIIHNLFQKVEILSILF